MAGSRRLDDEIRRLRRRLHLTPNGPEIGRLVLAAATSLILLLACWSALGLPPLTWLVAPLPVANHLRDRAITNRRRRRDEERTALTVDLAGLDLAGAELPLADLRAKDLTSARLSQANLVGADLARTGLIGARLGRADLRYGSLEGSQCCDASFLRARLTETNLDGVDARGASFVGADLRDASLVGADLRRVRFDGADVRGADFTGARLAADALAGAMVDGATIRHDGHRSIPDAVPPTERWRTELSVASRRATLGIARPAAIGLAWSVAVAATALLVEASGGGLGDDLTEMASSDRAMSEQGSGTRVGLDDLFGGARTGAGSDRSAGRTEPGRTGDDPTSTAPRELDPAEVDAAAAGSGSAGSSDPADGSRSAGAAPGDPVAGGQRTGGPAPPGGIAGLGGVEPVSGAAQTGGSASPAISASSSGDPGSTTSPSSAAADGGGRDSSPTTTAPRSGAETTSPPGGDDDGDPVEAPGPVEATTPTVVGQVAVRLVRVLVGSDGGPSAATSSSSLGRSDPVLVVGEDGWEVSVAFGAVSVEVEPGDGVTSTWCRILVDDVERSFQAGLAGQTSTCVVDLDPAG